MRYINRLFTYLFIHHILSRYDTIPACDRQTDRQTDEHLSTAKSALMQNVAWYQAVQSATFLAHRERASSKFARWRHQHFTFLYSSLFTI